MAVESATNIPGLNVLWPLGTDAKAEGDDHIRLIKSVLKAEFPAGSAALKTALPRNRIVNPAMQISQEWGDTAVSGLAYALDQWQLNANIAGVAAQRHPSIVTPKNSRVLYSGTSTAKPALAAGDIWLVRQPIEGVNIRDFMWGTASAKPVVLRFSAFATGQAATYTVYVQNAAGSRAFLSNVALTLGWQDFKIVIPGDTAGVWPTDTGVGLMFGITLAAGSTYPFGAAGWNAGGYVAMAGQSNAAAVAGGGIIFGDVGLYLDSDGTGNAPPWQTPGEAEELRACQRYYEGMGVYNIFSGQVTSGSSYSAQITFQVPKRVAPAMSGTPQTAVGFPNTIGTLVTDTVRGYESRTASGTAPAGAFRSTLVASARM